jgi:HEAT repeat protein
MITQPRFTNDASRLVLVFLTFAICSATRANAAAGPAATVEQRIEKVKADLKSTDPLVRQSAIKSLVHSDISAKLVAEMRTALDDHDGDVRATAATAIGNVGALAVPAIGQLIAQLKSDPVKEARETAARALGRIGKAAGDEKGLIDPLRAAARDDADPVTRVVAHGALAMMNVELEDEIAAIRKYLHNDDALVRMKAAHALGMIGKPARAAAPEIVEVLKRETDGHRRGYVARALGSTGDPASLPILEAALEKETDPGARGEMRGAISRLKAQAAEKGKP